MLKILKGGTTNLITTVTELTTISNPEYLFEFVEEQTDESYYCILSDSSLYTGRYNEFAIIDGSDLTFPRSNYYTYSIYEQANGSGNLDPTGLTIVEKGRAWVYEADTNPNEYTNDSETDTVYDPA